jgi:hypothetical protein
MTASRSKLRLRVHSSRCVQRRARPRQPKRVHDRSTQATRGTTGPSPVASDGDSDPTFRKANNNQPTEGTTFRFIQGGDRSSGCRTCARADRARRPIGHHRAPRPPPSFYMCMATGEQTICQAQLTFVEDPVTPAATTLLLPTAAGATLDPITNWRTSGPRPAQRLAGPNRHASFRTKAVTSASTRPQANAHCRRSVRWTLRPTRRRAAEAGAGAA